MEFMQDKILYLAVCLSSGIVQIEKPLYPSSFREHDVERRGKRVDRLSRRAALLHASADVLVITLVAGFDEVM